MDEQEEGRKREVEGEEEETGGRGRRRGDIIALLHSFATGLGYLVGTSGHKQPSSCLLLKDPKAPCHNKATGTPQQFLQEIYKINFPTYRIHSDVYFKLVHLVLQGTRHILEK